MVTWHLTMKLFPAKCHVRATLRKLWRQTGNSSLLPAKCWPLLHVIRGGLMLSLESQRVFSNFAFVLFCYNKSLNGWSLGEQWISFPENLNVSRDEVEGNIEIRHCDLLYSKTKQKQNLKTALRFQWSRKTAVNISRVTVACFPFDIVFAMLPAHGIWRETCFIFRCHVTMN